jgi:methionyl aminopeptidase
MDSVRAQLTKGSVSPIRSVPSSIPRPDYVGKRRASHWRGGDVHSAETIARIRSTGHLAAQALAEVGRHVVPGVTTDELDRIGHEFLVDHGAYPSTLGYPGSAGRRPYPKSLCTSINEVICHGIPDSTVVQEGDIVKVDITAFKDGVHGDNCGSYIAGQGSPEARALVEATREALARGIAAVRPGREVNVIGRVIEAFATRNGYESVRNYTGHGVGPSFHSGLVIPHYDSAPMHSDVIKPGMVFTIEPMLVAGSELNYEWDDGWTVSTDDGSWCAQFESTLVVTDDGVEILTIP